MANSFAKRSTYVSLKSPYLQPNSIRALKETRRQFLKLVENKPITGYSGADVLTFVRLRGGCRQETGWCQRRSRAYRHLELVRGEHIA